MRAFVLVLLALAACPKVPPEKDPPPLEGDPPPPGLADLQRDEGREVAVERDGLRVEASVHEGAEQQ
jgi:hypothetical protein